MDKFWQAAKLRAALLTAAASVAAAGPALAQEATQTLQTFNIPSQNTASALLEFARQADAQILFSHDAASKTTAPALVGEYTRDQALGRLLMGSSLSIASDDGRTVTLRAQDEAGGQANEPERVENAANVAQGEIVIVGTNIRGLYPESSPFQIYDLEEIARTGALTVDKFVERLPQNFGTRSQYAPIGSGGIDNFDSVVSVDLRGIGVGTTLTLLNGRRLALASNGLAADVSMIPLSAIERVEVLTDGASAIYGADAVGGVVNFVLRDSFDGAETRASYGGVTSGRLRQGNFSQTFGRSWGSGNALASYDYFSASPLETLDRSYSVPAGPGYLTPVDQRHSGLVTFSQDIGDRVSVSGDVLYSQRGVKNFGTEFDHVNDPPFNVTRQTSSETEQYFADLGADIEISGSLVASVRASYSDISVNSIVGVAATNDTNDTTWDITAKLDGDLFELPGGPLRFSIGGGFTDEEYLADVTIINVPSGRTFGRNTTYAFGELFAPFVGAEQNIPLIHRLELSLAARFTDYEDDSEPATSQDFGSGTSPKIGVLWAPVRALSLRGTYGESFRAPTLSELDPSSFTVIAPFFPIGTEFFPIISPSSVDPDLGVETSESWTAGFDLRPNGADGPYLSVTYFNIDYVDRIGRADILQAIFDPERFPDVVYPASSVEEIESLLREGIIIDGFEGAIPLDDLRAAAEALFALRDTFGNFFVVDGRVKNFTQSQLDGIDVSVGGHFDTQLGRFDIGAEATRILEFKEQATPGSAVVTATDVVLSPSDFRARLFGTLTQGGFSTTINVNYVDDYKNPLPTGTAKVDDWTTVDWSTKYEFGGDGGLLPGFGLTLSVQNVFDADPPRVDANDVFFLFGNYGFDPSNANPLGRVVLFGVSKKW